MARTEEVIPSAIDAFANKIPRHESAPPRREDSIPELLCRLVGEMFDLSIPLEDVDWQGPRPQIRFADAVFTLRIPGPGWGRPELEFLSFRCDGCGAHRHGWWYPVAIVQARADVGRIITKHLATHARTAEHLRADNAPSTAVLL